MCKAKQAEAKIALGDVFADQVAYCVEYDTYGVSLAEIGFSSLGDTVYNISIISADSAGFSAKATAVNLKGDNDDVWTIDHNAVLRNDTNACQ